MRRRMSSVALVGLAALVCAAVAGCEQLADHDQAWTARYHRRDGKVTLKIRLASHRERHSHSFRLPVADLEGLEPADLGRRNVALAFTLVRDAGRLEFEGLGGWWPRGSFRFVPDPEYGAVLEQAGFAATRRVDLLRLAVRNVPRTLPAGLFRLGYARLDVDDLVRLQVHRIDSGYAEAMQALGQRPSIDDLVRLRTQGIEADQARAVREYGLAPMPVRDLVRLHVHDIALGYVSELRDAGLDTVDVERVVRLHVHAVRSELVGALAAVLEQTPSVGELVRVRVHRIAAADLREIAAAGLAGLTVENLVSLRVHRVPPDLVAAAREAGFDSIEVVVRLRTHGFSAPLVEAYASSGFGLDSGAMIRLKAHGVQPALLAELARTGHDDLSIDELIRIRTSGTADLFTR